MAKRRSRRRTTIHTKGGRTCRVIKLPKNARKITVSSASRRRK